MAPGMDGQIRPARASGAGGPSGPSGASSADGLAAGRPPVPAEGETREMSETGSDKRPGITADEQGGQKRADKLRGFQLGCAVRRRSGTTRSGDHPHRAGSTGAAQFRPVEPSVGYVVPPRDAAVEAGKPGDTRQPINLGMKAACS